MLFSNIIIIQPQTALKIGVSLAVMQKVKTNKYFWEKSIGTDADTEIWNQVHKWNPDCSSVIRGSVSTKWTQGTRGRMESRRRLLFRGKVNSNRDLKAIQLGGKLFYEGINIRALMKQFGSAWAASTHENMRAGLVIWFREDSTNPVAWSNL